MGRLQRGVWRPVGGRHPYWTVLIAESKQGTVRDWGREGPKTPPIAEAAGGNHMVDEARWEERARPEETRRSPARPWRRVASRLKPLWVTVLCTVWYRWLGRDSVRLDLTEP